MHVKHCQNQAHQFLSQIFSNIKLSKKFVFLHKIEIQTYVYLLNFFFEKLASDFSIPNCKLIMIFIYIKKEKLDLFHLKHLIKLKYI